MAVEDCESAKHRAIRELILNAYNKDFSDAKGGWIRWGSVLFFLYCSVGDSIVHRETVSAEWEKKK